MADKRVYEVEIRTILDRIADAQEAANQVDGAGAFSVTYIFPAKDWGATFTEVINTPAGFRGKVKSIMIYDVTEIFSNAVSDARVDIGDGADANGFAFSAGLGTTGVAASAAPAVTEGVLGAIPSADIVTVTGVAAGTPGTGIATLAVTINYFI